jgi:LPXTG-motif cell wall-anchored protein
VDIKLTDLIEEGSSYTLTIVSAISEDGVVIKDGAQALKEFTPPIPLKRSLITFNAPSNPNAVIVKDTPAINTPVIITPPVAQTQTGAPEIKDKELPLTGTNPALFAGIALIAALILLLKRKKA